MKIKSLFILAGALWMTSACTKLDESVYSQVNGDEYGATSGEVATIVGGAYASLRGGSDASEGGTHYYPVSEYVFFVGAISSDECTLPTRVGGDWGDGGQYIQLQSHTWDANNKTIWSVWKYCYFGISKVNNTIYQVENSGLSDNAKTIAIAELRAVRAYYYYKLLDNFGNVPIVTQYGQKESVAKSPRADVYKFVKDELLDVIDKLPTSGYAKMTQNAGNLLLARLYLNASVYINEPHWQDCLEVCDKISGSLNPDYFANFATDNEKSSEIIFAIPYDHKANTLGNYMPSMSFHYEQKWAFSYDGSYPWCGNGMCAQPGLYSSFDATDMRRKSILIGEQINLSTGSVIIMPASGSPLIYTEDIIDNLNALQNEGARLMKYQVRADDQWNRDNDMVLMRYAEVLTMKAECNARLGNLAAARTFMEPIRMRAGLETPATIDLQFINDELRREFVFEDHRRTDNIRFGDFFNPWWKKGATPATRGIFPIPAQELDKNPKLVQNPGY